MERRLGFALEPAGPKRCFLTEFFSSRVCREGGDVMVFREKPGN